MRRSEVGVRRGHVGGEVLRSRVEAWLRRGEVAK